MLSSPLSSVLTIDGFIALVLPPLDQFADELARSLPGEEEEGEEASLRVHVSEDVISSLGRVPVVFYYEILPQMRDEPTGLVAWPL